MLQKVADIVQLLECIVIVREEKPEIYMLVFLDSQIKFSFVGDMGSASAI
jgi:hypothetical protein